MLNVRLAQLRPISSIPASLVGLRRWLGEHSQCSAVDLLVQAAELADKGPRMFSIWVRVNDLPEIVRLADPCPLHTSR